MAMAPLLQLRGITKQFGATRALAGVDLEIQRGEVHAIVGENGAGKSTLVNVLSGTVRPDAGEVIFDGAPYRPLGSVDARRAGIAHIHQELSLCRHLTVAENILMGAEPAQAGWIQRDAMRERAASLLESFGRADIDPRAQVGGLALASQQVVEICRALAWNPKVILMDEPTSSLQRENVERLFAAIRRLKASGVAILYISHFLEEVREIADRYTVLRDGVSVSSGELAAVSDPKLILDMVGRPVEAIFEHDRAGEAGDVILEVRNLTCLPGLQSASFELRRGEVLGIAGLIGSGRTEMMKALFGLESPTSGEIRLRGKEAAVTDATSGERIGAGFGYLSEDRRSEGLALPMSAADNITMTRLSSCSSRGWLSLAHQREQAARCMATLKVKARGPEAIVASLSGGNQQKVAMARLLHQDPDILLLDEPTRGIDVGSKADLYAEISRLAGKGKAIVMVSSYLPELFGVCDRIAVMSRGRLSSARKVTEWTPESVMETAISVADERHRSEE
jgi:ribose transport system ATP-binding protein